MNRELLHQSELVRYYLEPDNRLLYCYWFACEHPAEALFRRDIEQLCALIVAHRPQAVLDNSLEVDYPIGPLLQTWIADRIHAAMLAGGATKYALISPQDLIAELSNEQTFSEIEALQDGQAPWQQAEFHSEEEARAWLGLG